MKNLETSTSKLEDCWGKLIRYKTFMKVIFVTLLVKSMNMPP
jgi:hypothetical protein